MSSARLALRVGAVKVVGVARLHDFVHRFNKRGNDGTAKGNIKAAPSAVVVGVLYELRAEQLATLDSVESGYERIQVRVTKGVERVLAESFQGVTLSDAVVPELAYLYHYIDGGREHGLEPAYLRSILPPWAHGAISF